jgi:hypothetical protein
MTGWTSLARRARRAGAARAPVSLSSGGRSRGRRLQGEKGRGSDAVAARRGDAPPGVQVTVDGVIDDLPIRLARDGAVHVVRSEAPGYEAKEPERTWHCIVRRICGAPAYLTTPIAKSSLGNSPNFEWQPPQTRCN